MVHIQLHRDLNGFGLNGQLRDTRKTNVLFFKGRIMYYISLCRQINHVTAHDGKKSD